MTLVRRRSWRDGLFEFLTLGVKARVVKAGGTLAAKRSWLRLTFAKETFQGLAAHQSGVLVAETLSLTEQCPVGACLVFGKSYYAGQDSLAFLLRRRFR
jgi:hypothetical protein